MYIGEIRAASIGLFMLAGPSMAAEPPPTQEPATDTGISEVIVTAQRFTESAQKTPLILSVIDAGELQGVSDIRQLQSVEPSVQIGGSGGLTQTFIRGVGSATALNGQESAIAYNVDGVFLFTPSMVTPLMYDLDRIEVLKGPQGTLYGRNASGGAINLITVGARLGVTEGYVEGELGDYDRQRITGAVNLPLGDDLAVRLAGQHVEHDGYLSDGTDDQKVTSGRVRVRWEPSSDVTLLVGADVSDQDANGPGSSLNSNPTDDKWLGGLDPRADTGPFFLGGTSLFSLPPNPPPFLKNKQWSANAQLDVDLGFATLTVLPAYRYELARYLDYVPGFSDLQRAEAREKTVEVRLANRSDELKWVAGAYYIKNDLDTRSVPRQELLGGHSLAQQEFNLNSYAFFGEGTLSISDGFRVIGGLRYTYEKTTTGGFTNGMLPPTSTPAYDPAVDPFDFPISGRATANAVSWKGGVELDLSASSLLFATASRGFKGGGNYANNPGLRSSFKPEYLTAFELGSRNRFLDNTLQLNGELFYWKLKDQQHVFLALNQLGLPILATENAGKGHQYGGALDVVWEPTRNDSLRAGVEYMKSEYDSFVRVLPAVTTLTSTVCDVSFSGPGPFDPTTVDCSGQPLLRAPEWAASAGYEHRFDLGNAGGLTFNAGMTYASGRYLTLNYTRLAYQGPNELFDAALAYETPEQAVTITGWIRNIGDSRVMVNADQFIDGYTRPILLPPRTFGVSVRYTF